MARDEKAIYGSYTIGGASGPQILDRYGFEQDEDSAEFVCTFLIQAASYGALQTACATAEAALSTPRQRLEVSFGASKFHVFDADPNAGTFPASGFDQAPKIRKLSGVTDTGNSRGYEFRCQVALPPNLAGQNGLRDSRINLHYDVDERRVVTISGTYTEMPGSYARAQFLAQIDGNSGYAKSRLDLVDNTASWALTRREESDNDSRSILTFTREYSEHVNGRRGSRPQIAYAPSRNRIVTIRGAYLRTVSPANSATTNYLDNTNGENVHSAAILAALNAAQGGALTVGQTCELIGETAVPNEQDDRLDFTRVYRELIHSQSGGTFLDDPEVLADEISFAATRNPINDSPVPAGGGAAVANVPAPIVPGGLTTQERPASSLTTQSAPSDKPSSPSSVRKFSDLIIHYECSIKNTNTSLRTKWEGTLRPYLIGLIGQKLGISPVTLARDSVRYDVPNNRIIADVLAQGLESPLIAFEVAISDDTDLGLRISPVFNGQAHAYLIQQGPPRQTRQRRISAAYQTGAFSGLKQFSTPPSVATGWRLVHTSSPDLVTRTVGVPALGIPTINITSERLVEELVYVSALVRGIGTQGSPGGNPPAPGGPNDVKGPGGKKGGGGGNGSGGTFSNMASGSLGGASGGGGDFSGFSFGFGNPGGSGFGQGLLANY